MVDRAFAEGSVDGAVGIPAAAAGGVAPPLPGPCGGPDGLDDGPWLHPVSVNDKASSALVRRIMELPRFGALEAADVPIRSARPWLQPLVYSQEIHVEATHLEDVGRRLAEVERALADSRQEVERLRASIRRNAGPRAWLPTMASIAIVLATVAGVSRFTEAQGTGQTVMAPFTVVDRSGRTIMKVDGDTGAAELQLFNSSKTSVAALWADGLGTGNLQISDAHGNQKFRVFVDNAGGGVMGMFGKNGRVMADLMEGDNGGRGMYIYNSKGVPVVRLMSRGDDGGQVTAGEGKKQSGIVATGDGSSMQLMDPSGKLVWYLTDKRPTSGSRGMWLYNSEEKTIAAIKANADNLGEMGVAGPGKYFAAYLSANEGGSIRAGVRETGTATFEGNKSGAFIYNDAGAAEVGVTYSNQGGIIAIGNSAGNTMVDAGVLENGRGVVRAYPLGGATPIPIPHFIEGWGGPH